MVSQSFTPGGVSVVTCMAGQPSAWRTFRRISRSGALGGTPTLR